MPISKALESDVGVISEKLFNSSAESVSQIIVKIVYIKYNFIVTLKNVVEELVFPLGF